jgi:hypothetical protein
MDEPKDRGTETREPRWLDEISISTKIVVVVTLVTIGGFFFVLIAEMFL